VQQGAFKPCGFLMAVSAQMLALVLDPGRAQAGLVRRGAKWWWALPTSTRGLLLIGACLGVVVTTLEGNANATLVLINVGIIGVLLLAFVIAEARHRANSRR